MPPTVVAAWFAVFLIVSLALATGFGAGGVGVGGAGSGGACTVARTVAVLFSVNGSRAPEPIVAVLASLSAERRLGAPASGAPAPGRPLRRAASFTGVV